MPLLLVADIGGTKSDVALFDLSREPETPLHHKRYQNRAFQSFGAVLTDFLRNSPSPEYGCLGVAAVVKNGIAKLTNSDWILERSKLQDTFSLKDIWLINDLTAVCSSLPLLQNKDCLTIQQGQREADGIQAVLAPGTGLGEGFLLDGKNCFLPRGSEGGHCDFAPLNSEQSKLLAFMRNTHNTVSYELLCSGIGIPNIFDYLSTTDILRDKKRMALILSATDRTAPIVEGAHGNAPCPLCTKTVTLFLEILGAEAGNLALKTYATGGLFIGGGILPRIAEYVSFDGFLAAFCQKEKMVQLMESIPIHIIQKRDAALLGCAHFGYKRYLEFSLPFL